jgi:hypothetical protein
VLFPSASWKFNPAKNDALLARSGKQVAMFSSIFHTSKRRIYLQKFMTRLSKILLAVSVAGFVAGGIIDFGGFNLGPSWAVVLPLGAIAFGLFLIVFMLEKEMAGFDEEEAKKLRLASSPVLAARKQESKFIQLQPAT